jgi:hypothetical protein
VLQVLRRRRSRATRLEQQVQAPVKRMFQPCADRPSGAGTFEGVPIACSGCFCSGFMACTHDIETFEPSNIGSTQPVETAVYAKRTSQGRFKDMDEVSQPDAANIRVVVLRPVERPTVSLTPRRVPKPPYPGVLRSAATASSLVTGPLQPLPSSCS